LFLHLDPGRENVLLTGYRAMNDVPTPRRAAESRDRRKHDGLRVNSVVAWRGGVRNRREMNMTEDEIDIP
jgi:hypothetical protein